MTVPEASAQIHAVSSELKIKINGEKKSAEVIERYPWRGK
jgi:hypothetical protein